MSNVDEIRGRLSELRELYMRATPTQRYKVARDRISNPSSIVNQLVQQVGAVEGFARAVVLDLKRRSGVTPEEAYRPIRYLNAVALITEHITPACGKSPSDLFGIEDWELFTLAVEVRNFLVHEASSLRAGYTSALTDSCGRVLDVLAKIAGVST